jgi:hypothetical protein
MEERVNKFNALMLAVLKGHLIIEQAMDELLRASFFHPDHVREDRFSFAQKARMCRSMSLVENKDGLWTVLSAVNKLRNQIAHSLDADEIQKKMDKLRKVFLSTLTAKQAASLEGQPDDFVAQSACVLCAGFLTMLQGDAKSRRKVIDDHWKPDR